MGKLYGITRGPLKEGTLCSSHAIATLPQILWYAPSAKVAEWEPSTDAYDIRVEAIQ